MAQLRRRAVASGLQVGALWLRDGAPGAGAAPVAAGRRAFGGEGKGPRRPPAGGGAADFAETRRSSDPNVFRGPGGYTAAELFQQLRRAEAMDPGEEAAGPASPSVMWPDDEELRQMGVRELQTLLRSAGVGFGDCLDKESLIERARERRPSPP